MYSFFSYVIEAKDVRFHVKLKGIVPFEYIVKLVHKGRKSETL